MSVAFPVTLYGNAGLGFAGTSVGQLPASQPSGPNLVRWMAGGLQSLLTVNNSNLGRAVVMTYAHFSGSLRFSGPTFVQCALTRIGPNQQVFPLSLIYPST